MNIWKFYSHQIIDGKFDELEKDFANAGIELVFDGHLDLPETSELLMENAEMKAKAALKQRPDFHFALGDDSGVFIEALDYMPGVHSRRWFGEDDDDHGRNQKILEIMKDEANRDAFLISRFVLVNKDGEALVKTSVKNHFIVAYSERGKQGFGYDNILIPTVDSQEDSMWKNLWEHGLSEDDVMAVFDDGDFDFMETTIGEMTQEQKNLITFRGRIAEKIKTQLIEEGVWES